MFRQPIWMSRTASRNILAAIWNEKTGCWDILPGCRDISPAGSGLVPPAGEGQPASGRGPEGRRDPLLPGRLTRPARREGQPPEAGSPKVCRLTRTSGDGYWYQVGRIVVPLGTDSGTTGDG